jgi:hypothetical protein
MSSYFDTFINTYGERLVKAVELFAYAQMAGANTSPSETVFDNDEKPRSGDTVNWRTRLHYGGYVLERLNDAGEISLHYEDASGNRVQLVAEPQKE